MATFYQRYVPPGTVPSHRPTENGITGSIPNKRKHEDVENERTESPGRRKVKKNKKENTKHGSAGNSISSLSENFDSKKKKEDLHKAGEKSSRIQAHEESAKAAPRQGAQVLAKYSITKAPENLGKPITLRSTQTNGQVGDMKQADEAATNSHPHHKKKYQKERNPEKPSADSPLSGTEIKAPEAPDKPNDDTKHASIRSKFEKAKIRSDRVERRAKQESSENSSAKKASSAAEVGAGAEVYGLQPLPQPPEVTVPVAQPTYSTLPGWLAKPSRVSQSEKSKFEDLGISDGVVSNLRARGLEEAFPVQSAVLPLLLSGSQRYHGDICISAATGSGKTLAYVLPMIEALRNLAVTKLRGLIIVPTRELVKQAREICELCAAGTSLKIATALGSKSIQEERGILVKKRLAYRPEQYQQEQKNSIDWTSFNLQNAFEEVDDEGDDSEDFITEYTSKVDILICTPGRLVDHLRATPGFNLNDVQWLVIDEVDRLLNESFQEWVEVVIPALESSVSDQTRSRILRHMRLEVPERQIQRVILSATLTQDISKLKSLGLRNPKLIVVGEQNEPDIGNEEGTALSNSEMLVNSSGSFNLPPTLSESVVPVGDESTKPLQLLELLRLHVFKEEARIQAREESATSDSDSSDSSDSDSSDSTDSASSESDSSSTSEEANMTTKTTKSIPNPRTSAEGQHNANTALVFTRSTESATRLARLLTLLDPDLSTRLSTLTKSSSGSTARKARSQLRQGKLSLLVATDLASRGLDLPDLAHVISYDVPTSTTTYVHRVGRTARAGKPGHAWTLLAHREARWFWNEIGGKAGGSGSGSSSSLERNASNTRSAGDGENTKISRHVGNVVRRVHVPVSEDEALQNRYAAALKTLGEEARGLERAGA